MRWIEVGLMMLLSVVPALMTSLLALAHRFTVNVSNGQYLHGALHQASVLCLLWYVLQRSGRSVRSLGMNPRWSGLGHGVLLYIASSVALTLLLWQLRMAQAAMGAPQIKMQSMTSMVSAANPLILFFYATLNPWFEELIVRAYLMTEISELSGSMAIAVAVSTILQASYHLYQGWTNAIALAGIFLVYSLYYAKTRNIFPVIMAHMLQDYAANWQLWHKVHPR